MADNNYDDYDWDELPEDAKDAATALGYTQALWDGDKTPDACDESWADLTSAQQEAAAILGYTEATWDAE